MRSLLRNVALFAVSISLPLLLMEAYEGAMVDDGIHFDLEMRKYALSIKRPSADAEIGHDHAHDGIARALEIGIVS